MEAAAADLLAALSSPSSHAGIHCLLAAYRLRPFTAHLPASNPSLNPPPPGAIACLRPLAKRFLPFLSRALQLLPPLVRASSGGAVRCAEELFEIYALLLDCLAAISPCLAGKPYSVLLQRGRFVCCLESRGRLGRAEEEAVAALDALRSALSPPAASNKSLSRRGGGGAASAASIILLPDPAGVAGEAGTDPDVATLAVELTVCLANCASKRKVKEAAPYERVLSLVEQLQPWLPILPENVSRKYLTLLLNAMSRCTFFLAAEPSVLGKQLFMCSNPDLWLLLGFNSSLPSLLGTERKLPWKNLPVLLRNQEIYRMPSMGNFFLALTRYNNHYKEGNVMAPRFPAIDPFNTFYLLNPSGDLTSTQKEFEQFFRNYKWKGKAGHNPTSEELVMALENYDLFLYFGHGSGTKHVNLKEIEKLNDCASAVLMGCSSGALHCKGSYAPHGAPLSYLSGGSPAVVANLWDVSDKDIDRFSKALLHSWLREDSADDSNCSQCSQLTQESESINIGVEGNDRRDVDTKRCSCRQRRVCFKSK